MSLPNDIQHDIIVLFYSAKHRLEYNRVLFLASRFDKPVIIYLSDHDEIDELVGLRMGANDVLHDDMSINVLCERITAVHRRHQVMPSWSRDTISGRARLIPNSYFVDVLRNEFWVGDQRFDFTAAEIIIVDILSKRRGGIVSREDLVASIASVPGKSIDIRSIDSHVKRIRRKIKKRNQKINLIQTVYGYGYKLALTSDGRQEPSSKSEIM